MKNNKEEKSPFLLEGELHLDQNSSIKQAEVKIRILDITHVDAESILLAESTEAYIFKKDELKIPFKISGPEPDPSCDYIVAAVISVENEKGDKKTIYRTTQSIPVFKDGDLGSMEIPLTKIGEIED